MQLRFVEGLSQRDAADRLEMGRQRIRTRELKLRKRLLVFLRGRGDEGLVRQGMLLPLPAVGTELARAIAEVLR